jgi:large-conductance mechanosensitive channel
VLRRAIRAIFNRVVWRFLRKTVIGAKSEEVGVDLGDLIEAVVAAIIIALSILMAINASVLWARS